MKQKALEILRAIAADKDNAHHTTMSLAQKAAVEVALHELEQPEPTIPHPLLEALNAHIRKIVAQEVEQAVNGSFSDIEEKIADAESRLNSLENAENEDLSDVQRRLDDVEAYESRLEDLESWQRNADDERCNDLENRIDDLESTQGDHEDALEEVQKDIAALMRGDNQTGEWSNKMEQRINETHDNLNSLLEAIQEQDEEVSKVEARLETLEAATKLNCRDIVLACINYIRERIA